MKITVMPTTAANRDGVRKGDDFRQMSSYISEMVYKTGR